MGMKRRLPLMLNDAPTASKSRKTGSSSSDYGLEISSLADSEEDIDDDDTAYMNLMTMDNPIVLQSKMQSSRGMISEIPNTPSSTRSHHDELEDIDDIIEEEAPEDDVNKIFEELSEATSGPQGQGQQRPSNVVTTRSAKRVPVNNNNNNTKSSAVVRGQQQLQPIKQQPQQSNVSRNENTDMDEFLKFENTNAPVVVVASTSSSTVVNNEGGAAVANVVDSAQQQQQVKPTWYANKDAFISAEIPNELFDDQSQSSMGGGAVIGTVTSQHGLQDNNINPTLSENLTAKIDAAESSNKNNTNTKSRKFSGKHLQLARLPSNTGDVFSLATPEDFTLHLDSVQTDLNALKGILATDSLVYDPNQLTGVSGYLPFIFGESFRSK